MSSSIIPCIALAAWFQVVSSDRGNASEINFFSLTISSSSQSLLISNRPLSLRVVRNTILLSYVLAHKDFISRWESRFVVLMPFRYISKSREMCFFSWNVASATSICTRLHSSWSVQSSGFRVWLRAIEQ